MDTLSAEETQPFGAFAVLLAIASFLLITSPLALGLAGVAMSLGWFSHQRADRLGQPAFLLGGGSVAVWALVQLLGILIDI